MKEAKKNLNYDTDYTVKNGRLINNAPPLEMGITKLANAKRAMRHAEKVNVIVEANEITKMRDQLGDM